jgi:hypothetical protein
MRAGYPDAGMCLELHLSGFLNLNPALFFGVLFLESDNRGNLCCCLHARELFPKFLVTDSLNLISAMRATTLAARICLRLHSIAAFKN